MNGLREDPVNDPRPEGGRISVSCYSSDVGLFAIHRSSRAYLSFERDLHEIASPWHSIRSDEKKGCVNSREDKLNEHQGEREGGVQGFNGDIEGRARGKGEPRLLLAWVDKV